LIEQIQGDYVIPEYNRTLIQYNPTRNKRLEVQSHFNSTSLCRNSTSALLNGKWCC